MERFVSNTKSFTWYIVDENDAPIDISDMSTINFIYTKSTGVQVTIGGTITNATGGEVTFSVLNTDFDEVGDFIFYIDATYSNAETLTVIKDNLRIISKTS